MATDEMAEYIERALGVPLWTVAEGQRISPAGVAAALWPLNGLFRPVLVRIRTVRYRPRFAPRADEAIAAFAERPVSETWEHLEAGTWRVLLERHQQLELVLHANAAAGRGTFTTLPRRLERHHWLPALMLGLLHQMTLPWPAADRSRLELPEAPPVASLRLH